MSLILEALRKSEAERRRAQAPDLFAEPQLALPRARPAWPHWRWLAMGAVALVVGVLLVRSMRVPATPAAAAPLAAPQPAPAAPGVATSTPIRSAPSANAPAASAAARQPAAGHPTTPEPSLAARPVAAAVVAPPIALPRTQPQPSPDPVGAAPAVPAPVPAATADAGTQPLADLGPEERQQLPPLKLSMHMWNDTPAQRFVILDGQRLGEGDRIGAAVVEQITRDGAILAWNGRRLRVAMR